MLIPSFPRVWRVCVSAANTATPIARRFLTASAIRPNGLRALSEQPSDEQGASFHHTNSAPPPGDDAVSIKQSQPANFPITADEARKFIKLYDSGASKEEVARKLPNRGFEDLVYRYRRGDMAKLLQNEKDNTAISRYWTKDEKALFLELRRANVATHDMYPYFPHRSSRSIRSVALRPDWDRFWTSSKERKPWTAAEIKYLKESIAQGNSRLEIARVLDRSTQGIRGKCKSMGLGHRESWYTREVDEEVHRLRTNGIIYDQIAATLGRNVSSLCSQYYRSPYRSESGKGRSRSFRLSPRDVEDIEKMSSQGLSWETIQQERFPQTPARIVRQKYLAYVRDLKGIDILEITPADAQEIRRLRAEEKSWPQITQLKYPERGHDSVRRAYLSKVGKEDSPPPLKMSATDIEDITRMRNAGKSWRQIRDLKFQRWSPKLVAETYRRLTGKLPIFGRPAIFSEADVEEIDRMREEGMFWPDIRDLKYPGRSVDYGRDYLANPSQRRRGESKDPKPAPRVLSMADLQDIERLRENGSTVAEVRTLICPERSESWLYTQTKRLKQLRAEHEQASAERSDEKKEDRSPLDEGDNGVKREGA